MRSRNLILTTASAINYTYCYGQCFLNQQIMRGGYDLYGNYYPNANDALNAEMTMEQAKRRVLNAPTVSF